MVAAGKRPVRHYRRPLAQNVPVLFLWVPGIIWFLFKVTAVFFMFAMVKAFVPRYRYDQLMRLGWKVFLPLSLAMVVIVAGFLQYGPAGLVK